MLGALGPDLSVATSGVLGDRWPSHEERAEMLTRFLGAYRKGIADYRAAAKQAAE